MFNYLLFSSLALFWGGSFVAIKHLIHTVPSFSAALFRVLFSLIFLLLIYSRKLTIPKGFWGKELALTSIAGLCAIGIPFCLLFWGENFISPSIAGVLNGTVPFWTLILSIAFFGGLKDLNIKKVMGLLVGFLGLLVIFWPKLKLNSSGDQMEILGLLAVTGMALFYGLGINLTQQILTKNKIITGFLNTIVQQAASVILLIIATLIVDGVPDFKPLLEPKAFLSVIYLSLFSTCIAFIIFYRLITIMGPVKSSAVTFFVPPVAMGLDAFIYERSLTTIEITGAAIILISMLLLRKKDTAK